MGGRVGRGIWRWLLVSLLLDFAFDWVREVLMRRRRTWRCAVMMDEEVSGGGGMAMESTKRRGTTWRGMDNYNER